jgi:3-oxoacyl-[acyl-carrier-protein] synthase-3
MFFPATACLVQDKLGASRAWGFDLSAACCGFVYALTTGAHFVASGAHERVLVIGADLMSSILNYEDRATCVLFGDGAGAVLLEPADDEEGGLIDFNHYVEGSGGMYLETVANKMHYVHQDGRQVFKYAVRQTYEASLALLERHGLTPSDLSLLVAHQANARILDAAAERLGLPDEKVIKNIDKFGNTTAATIPLALWDAHEQGRLNPGDLILMVSVGAGLTVGSCLMRWTGLKSA